MSRYSTLVNCTILTMDDSDNFYPDGKIVIKDDKIFELGPTEEIKDRGEVIDMKRKILLPGLINTHTHSPSPLFRSIADDLPLMKWLKTVIWPAEKHLTAELAYCGASLSCLEFLRSGITTFADQYFFATSIAEACCKSGLRGFIAPTIFSNSTPETVDPLRTAVDFIEKYQGKEDSTRIYPSIGPHAPYSCSDDDLKQVADIAERYELMIHIHISETRAENLQIYEESGLSPTKYLASLGLLDRPVLAAHCIHLNPQDIELFSQKGVRVSYNPVSNLKLASGIMPMKELVQQGILISMGTDGAQSNNSLDLLRDLKTGALIQKQFNHDASFFQAREGLRMITINGAKALGIDDRIGSLAKGKRADLISLDGKEINLNPLHRQSYSYICSAIVYSASGLNVADVIIDGEVLMRDRGVVRVDSEEIVSEAQLGSEYILQKVGIL